MQMRIQYVHVLLAMIGVFTLCSMMCGVDAATLGDQCSDEFEKLANCLSYVTAKTDTPSKECCNSVSEIRNSEPVCLCYVILQPHHGSNEEKSLGIQEGKLLQLPSACKLFNSSVSDCPKLLDIPKGTPDYTFFTNSTTSNNTPSPTTPSPDGSKGFKHGPDHRLVGPVALAMAIFFYAFPAGSFTPSCF